MRTSRSWLGRIALIFVGFALGAVVVATRSAIGQAPENLPHRGLDSNLYLQTAAEYRACCLQAYNLAEEQLKQVKDAAKTEKPLAVVLDLDETVFDNGVYQTLQLRAGSGFDPHTWEAWEEKSSDQIELVPGAKRFLEAAVKLGVTPVYISNRNTKYLKTVTTAFVRLGLPPAVDTQFLLADKTSDKTDRRKDTEKVYHVVLYIGDNLRDFDDAYRFPKLDDLSGAGLDAAIKARKDRVDADRAAWGSKWIILPNPAYGEWQKPLGRGRDDLDRLMKPSS